MHPSEGMAKYQRSGESGPSRQLVRRPAAACAGHLQIEKGKAVHCRFGAREGCKGSATVTPSCALATLLTSDDTSKDTFSLLS